MKKEGFSISRGKGFHITFKNGVTVSVQFGGGNYCSNHDEEIGREAYRIQGENGSIDAEIAIFDEKGKWLTKEFNKQDDDVMGWQTPEDVLKALIWAEAYKPKK